MDIWVLGHLFKLLYGNKLRMVKNMEIINYYIMKVVNRNGRDVGLRKMVLMCKKQVEIRRSKNK